jgi:hypothetical protein
MALLVILVPLLVQLLVQLLLLQEPLSVQLFLVYRLDRRELLQGQEECPERLG